MTDNEIDQLMADSGNEAMETLKRLAADVIPMAAYGAGLQSSILMRRLRERARAKIEKPESTRSNPVTPLGRNTKSSKSSSKKGKD